MWTLNARPDGIHERAAVLMELWHRRKARNVFHGDLAVLVLGHRIPTQWHKFALRRITTFAPRPIPIRAVGGAFFFSARAWIARVAAVAQRRVCTVCGGYSTWYQHMTTRRRSCGEGVAAAAVRRGFLRRAREMCMARKRRGTALQDCTGSAVRPGEHRSTRRARARDWLPAEGGDGEISCSEQDHVR